MATLAQESNKKIVMKECSMCGDVGFEEQLFRCKCCLFRFQHTYCSRLYPNVDLDHFSCNWCVHTLVVKVDAEPHANDIKNTNKQQNICNNVERSVKRRAGGEENAEVFSVVKKMRKHKLHVHAARRYKRLSEFL